MKRALLPVCLLAGVLGVAGWRCWANRVQEFRGTLRWRDVLVIPEDPPGDAVLLTSAGAYELDVGRDPQWRDLLPVLDGKQVIVRGTLRVWRGPFMEHRRIRVRDLQPCAAAGTAPP